MTQSANKHASAIPILPMRATGTSSQQLNQLQEPSRTFRNKRVSDRPSERPSAPLGAAGSAERGFCVLNRSPPRRARMSSTQPDQLRWIALLS